MNYNKNYNAFILLKYNTIKYTNKLKIKIHKMFEIKNVNP